jgi:hypothetical protein
VRIDKEQTMSGLDAIAKDADGFPVGIYELELSSPVTHAAYGFRFEAGIARDVEGKHAVRAICVWGPQVVRVTRTDVVALASTEPAPALSMDEMIARALELHPVWAEEDLRGMLTDDFEATIPQGERLAACVFLLNVVESFRESLPQLADALEERAKLLGSGEISAEQLAEAQAALIGPPKASSACPMCGVDAPHTHTQDEINAYADEHVAAHASEQHAPTCDLDEDCVCEPGEVTDPDAAARAEASGEVTPIAPDSPMATREQPEALVPVNVEPAPPPARADETKPTRARASKPKG